MKLTEQGKKLELTLYIFLAAVAVLACSLYFDIPDILGGICFIALILSAGRLFSGLVDATYEEHGFFGTKHGKNPLFEEDC